MYTSAFISGTPNRVPPVQRMDNGSLEFSVDIVEVTILDRRGHAIWQTRRSPDSVTAHWDGIDMAGNPVEAGSYTCKLNFIDSHIVYVPFVFMK